MMMATRVSPSKLPPPPGFVQSGTKSVPSTPKAITKSSLPDPPYPSDPNMPGLPLPPPRSLLTQFSSVSQFKYLLTQKPQVHVPNLLQEAAELIMHNKFDLACKKFDMVLRLQPQNAQVYLAKCQCEIRRGSLLDALQDAFMAITFKHEGVDAYIIRADIFMKLKRYENAALDYFSVLQINPKHEKAQSQLMALARMGHVSPIAALSPCLRNIPRACQKELLSPESTIPVGRTIKGINPTSPLVSSSNTLKPPELSTASLHGSSGVSSASLSAHSSPSSRTSSSSSIRADCPVSPLASRQESGDAPLHSPSCSVSSTRSSLSTDDCPKDTDSHKCEENQSGEDTIPEPAGLTYALVARGLADDLDQLFITSTDFPQITPSNPTVGTELTPSISPFGTPTKPKVTKCKKTSQRVPKGKTQDRKAKISLTPGRRPSVPLYDSSNHPASVYQILKSTHPTDEEDSPIRGRPIDLTNPLLLNALWIRNVKRDSPDEAILSVFERYGTVVKFKHYTEKSRSAFVEFSTGAESLKAVRSLYNLVDPALCDDPHRPLMFRFAPSDEQYRQYLSMGGSSLKRLVEAAGECWYWRVGDDCPRSSELSSMMMGVTSRDQCPLLHIPANFNIDSRIDTKSFRLR